MRTFLLLAAAIVFCAACGDHRPVRRPPYTKAERDAMSPDYVLGLAKAGHARFLRGEHNRVDDQVDIKATRHGQYPLAVFLTCIDSRVPPDVLFDYAIGDAFVAAVAGNFVNPDILGSIEYACKVAGSKLIVVMGHTSCGAVKGACDGVELGNLTQMLAKIRPAIDSIADDGSARTSKNLAFVNRVAASNVRLTLAKLRADSPVLSALEAEGKIKIVGALYHVEDGALDWLED